MYMHERNNHQDKKIEQLQLHLIPAIEKLATAYENNKMGLWYDQNKQTSYWLIF